MRVHELARQLGMSSKDLLDRIRQLGGDLKSHMSLIDEEVLKLLQGRLEAPPKPTSEKKATEKKSGVSPATRQSTDEETSSTGAAVEQPAKSSPRHSAHEADKTASDKTVSEGSDQSFETGITAVESSESTAIRIRFPITVGHLAPKMRMKVSELIKELMGLGIFATVNQLLNEEIVFRLANKVGIAIEKEEDETEKLLGEKDTEEDPAKLKLRPPVVTLMGHVDHGKTSLLDAIRKTNVAAREKGFITQHIGAYGVEIPNKGYVTFLDTPGHEAFTAMRARGANVTDVVVLVVAADDGVMPQTVEAINHAREAGCPIVVAINKSDLPTANPQRVMMQLQKLDLTPEEWGGKTIFVKVSAKTGEGIDQLLEMLLLEAEILELKANPDRPAVGTVLEGHISRGSGAVATVLIQKGTLRIGDVVVSGPHMGRVRAMRNDQGKNVKEAGPSFAVEVSGLSGVPEAGQDFFVVQNERTARDIVEKRILELRERQISGAKKHLSLESLYERISEGNFKELKLIIKGDVQGSVEALTHSLEKLSTERCRLHVIHDGVGGINESDVMLAAASDAVVIGFHVRADAKAAQLAEKEGVDMRFYHLIYEVVEDVRRAMEGLLEPTYREVVEGRAQIRKIFKSSKVGIIGGAMVVKGKITRQGEARVIRNNIIVYQGKLSSLKRFKDDVREVAEGYECGISFAGYNDLQEGDTIESYRLEKVATKI